MQSIVQGVEESAGREGIRPYAVEGAQRGHWALIDFSDVIVHVFYEPVREFYDLDGLWGHAPRAQLPEAVAQLVGQFQIGNESLA